MRFAVWGAPTQSFPQGKDTKADFSVSFERMKRAGIEIYLCFIDTSRARDRDILAQCIEAGDEFGIEIHPYVGLKSPEGQAGEGLYDPGPSDEEVPSWATGWACPAWEENRELVRDTAAAMLGDYNCSGLHMDGMRYPNSSLLNQHPCHCSRCREAREEWLGKAIPDAEDLARPGVAYLEVKMRNRFVKSVVQALREVTDEAGVPLSLAARASYQSDAIVEGQDWVDWCREGLIDFICPMSYTTDTNHFERFVRGHKHLLTDVSTAMYCGIGRESSAGVIDAKELTRQIQCAAQHGADGICIFTAASCDEEDFQALQKLKAELG